MCTPMRRAASIRLSRESASTGRPSTSTRTTLGAESLIARPRRRSRSLLHLAADHVDGVEDGDDVRHRMPLDEARERREDREPRRAHLDGVRLALPVRDDVAAQLAVGALAVRIDLARRDLDAF